MTNCMDCQHYQDDGEVSGHFYCTWHNDWIPKKCINDNEGCSGHKGATWGSGYVPHSGMERFRCPRCGCVQFKCYPQTAPTDRSKTWTWEYVCAECGQGMGLTIKGED